MSNFKPLFDDVEVTRESFSEDSKRSSTKKTKERTASGNSQDSDSSVSYWPSTASVDIDNLLKDGFESPKEPLSSPLDDVDVIDYLNKRLTKTSLNDSKLTALGASARDVEFVPSCLIRRYTSMVDDVLAQNVEVKYRNKTLCKHDLFLQADITRHCAHAMPAVAFVVGRDGWHQLKITYRALARDKQWKVRLCVAQSMHHLAAIIGPENTTNDLVPVFRVRYTLLQYVVTKTFRISPTTWTKCALVF